MQKLCIYLIIFLCPFLSFSQDFTAKAEQISQIDEFGNVMNNDTDKQGMKQGDWFYVDINGNQIVKKDFANDKCSATYLFISDQWINTKELSTNLDNADNAIEVLQAKGLNLNKDRQVLVLLSKSGEFLSAHVLGDWTPDEEDKVVSILKAHFSKMNIESSSPMYLLL